MILGIDPGLSGAIAWLSRDDKGVVTMPVIDGRIELCAVSGLISAKRPDFAVIERQWPRPGGSASSTFTNGLNYGLLIGILISRGIPFVEVPPQTWKLALGLTEPVVRRKKGEPDKEPLTKAQQTAKDKARKDKAIRLALQLFPTVDFKVSSRCSTYSSDMCEAMLIADYGRRHVKV